MFFFLNVTDVEKNNLPRKNSPKRHDIQPTGILKKVFLKSVKQNEAIALCLIATESTLSYINPSKSKSFSGADPGGPGPPP